MTQRDYYAELGVPPEASPEQIKRAYRRLALDSHPYRGGSERRMRRLNEAWNTLSDPEARRAYDTERRLSARNSPDVPVAQKTRTGTVKKRKTSKPTSHTESPLIHLLGRLAQIIAYAIGRILGFLFGRK